MSTRSDTLELTKGKMMTEKTDLRMEAKKLGLDTSGTIKELKARIAAAAGTEPVDEGSALVTSIEIPDDDTAPVDEDTQPAENSYNISIGRTDKGWPWATSNRFSIGGSERYGLPIIGISSTNHVGPAPLVVPASELRELATLLTQLADAETPEEK